MTRQAQLVETECEYSSVNLSTDSTTVFTGPCIFYGAVVSTVLSAHACPIQDGATVIAAFAASAAVGTAINIQAGIRCATSLVVNPDDSGTGVITVWFRRVRFD
jgi:hypothetical protein